MLRPVAAIFLLAFAACSTGGDGTSFFGTVIEDRRPAPEFRLTDQFGNAVSMKQYGEDAVVILTFLYTYCPDICPIVAQHLRSIQQSLSGDAANVSILVVSVDPERDTVERAMEYSEDWGMMPHWAFLVGSEDELRPVWEAYAIAALVDGEGLAGKASTARTGGEVGGVDALRSEIASRYSVTHQAPIYLIDREWRIRLLHTLPIDPMEVVADIHALLRERE